MRTVAIKLLLAFQAELRSDHGLLTAYLHICEGATQLATGQTDFSTGKLISYLVSDFIKGKLTAQ